MSNEIKQLSIKSLSNSDNYIIPIYQRNYVWGEDEIKLLLDDILNSFKQNKEKQQIKNYYIGSLVVFKRNSSFEVIDGQQRLTTLSILLTKLGENSIKLFFEHRDASNNSLRKNTENVEKSISIENVFFIMQEKLKSIKKEIADEYESFKKFLLDNVVILRTEVPAHTDLNHYFEIMNSRGEQLEKHEVLKARLMNLLDKNKEHQEQKAFSMIWNACSNMGNYVQKGFPFSSSDKNSLRTNIFGENCNNTLSNTSFEKILPFYQEYQGDLPEVSLKSILDNLDKKENLDSFGKINISKEDTLDNQFNSIIDFPNFLMHVLRIYLNDNSIPLNDKDLIKQFESIKTAENVKEFIMVLIKVRLLFDRYIIKYQSNMEDSWVLRGLKKYHKPSSNHYYFKEIDTFGGNLDGYTSSEESDNESINEIHQNEQRRLVMLLSMFHVSFKQRIYKEWLYEVLNELYKKSRSSETFNILANDYIAILEEKANKYYRSRNEILSQLGKDNTLNGTSVPNYIFNYLDYLIWRDRNLTDDAKKFINLDEFKFSLSGNSVEHYFSQNKIEMLKDSRLLHVFGNLCLISNYQNSSLSDDSCGVKKERYKSELKCISLKQAIMLGYSQWTDVEIKEHNDEMRKILIKESRRIKLKKVRLF